MTKSPDGVHLDRISGTAATLYVALFAACRRLVAPFRSSNPTRLRAPKPDDTRIAASKAAVARDFGNNVRGMNEDTVSIIQPAFYPDMPFRAMSRDRSVGFQVAGIMPFAAALDGVAGGASIVMVELPPQITGEADSELAQELVGSIFRLLRRRAWMIYDGQVRDVTPGDIGVVCAHVSQVNAVRERLGPGLSDVFVETANCFQGIERPFMFVHHPLSGRANATAFHLDAGRLCVMLSRHRIGCWIFRPPGHHRAVDPVRACR